MRRTVSTEPFYVVGFWFPHRTRRELFLLLKGIGTKRLHPPNLGNYNMRISPTTVASVCPHGGWGPVPTIATRPM